MIWIFNMKNLLLVLLLSCASASAATYKCDFYYPVGDSHDHTNLVSGKIIDNGNTFTFEIDTNIRNKTIDKSTKLVQNKNGFSSGETNVDGHKVVFLKSNYFPYYSAFLPDYDTNNIIFSTTNCEPM